MLHCVGLFHKQITITFFDLYVFSDAKFTVPSFTGTNSYLQLRRTMKPNDDLMFEIRLKILNEDGIITFASQYPNGTGDFIAVTVVKGYLEFRLDSEIEFLR